MGTRAGLTISQFSDWSGLGRKAVYQLIDGSLIPYARRQGRIYLVPAKILKSIRSDSRFVPIGGFDFEFAENSVRETDLTFPLIPFASFLEPFDPAERHRWYRLVRSNRIPFYRFNHKGAIFVDPDEVWMYLESAGAVPSVWDSL